MDSVDLFLKKEYYKSEKKSVPIVTTVYIHKFQK